jgi:hypothetical protein
LYQDKREHKHKRKCKLQVHGQGQAPPTMSAPHDEHKPDVAHTEHHADAGRVVSHDAERELKAEYNGGRVEDSAAADYVDASVVITPEENKRLRRKIYKQ